MTDKHTLSAIRAAAITLDGGARDYDALLDLVGDARFVLLGEATHEQAQLFTKRLAVASRQADHTPALPLAGVRVLDLGWVWAAPHATMMLAFLGAEVIKVESSARLDITRRTNPFPPDMERGVNRSGYFGCLNQAKKSIGINLSQPQGKELVKQLAGRCDVMISNFGTGVLEKLGLGAEAMHGVNPDLIIAMISAFGQTGPLRHYMGYGPLISPLAGLSAATGRSASAIRARRGIRVVSALTCAEPRTTRQPTTAARRTLS